MTTILTLDVGNSHPHVGIHKDGALDKLVPLDEFFLRSGHQDLGADVWIAPSIVGQRTSILDDFLEANQSRVLPLMSWRERGSFKDMPVEYAETLGQDRLFQSYYLYKTQGNLLKNYTLALVSAGTFTTIDFLSRDGHMGGYILPGNQVYLDAFKHGAQLPVLNASDAERQPELTQELPTTTEAAVLMGLNLVMRGTYTFIDHNLSDGPMAFMVTGGHGQSHWKAIRKLDTTSNLLLPYNGNLVHEALLFLAQEFIKA